MIEPIFFFFFLDMLVASHRWQTWSWLDDHAMTSGANIHVPFRNFGDPLTFNMTLGRRMSCKIQVSSVSTVWWQGTISCQMAAAYQTVAGLGAQTLPVMFPVIMFSGAPLLKFDRNLA